MEHIRPDMTITRKQAIEELQIRYELGKREYMKEIPEYIQALGMAIEALQREEENGR